MLMDDENMSELSEPRTPNDSDGEEHALPPPAKEHKILDDFVPKVDLQNDLDFPNVFKRLEKPLPLNKKAG